MCVCVYIHTYIYIYIYIYIRRERQAKLVESYTGHDWVHQKAHEDLWQKLFRG